MENGKNTVPGIRLLRLTLENFKCIKHFDLDLAGMDGEVYATNGMGKTSLADAYFWLLTGKDSAGGMPADKLFPIDAPAGVEVVVTGEFQDGGGGTLSLGRKLKRKIQRSRGEPEAAMRGTSTEYSINGVVKPQREYIAFVQEHFGDEDTLRMLSDYRHFAQAMHWEERRELLIKTFAPYTSDSDVVKAHPEELGVLENYIGARLTVRELEDQQRRERRKLSKKLEEIPSRIDEAQRSKPGRAEPGEVPALPALAAKRAQILVELDKLRTGGAAAQAEADAAACQERLSRAKAEYLAQNRGGNEDLERQCASLRQAMQEAETMKSRCLGFVDSAKASLAVAQEELQQLREAAREIHYRTFPAQAMACPTCGQPLPLEKLEEARARFNEKRATDIEENRARGTACAQSVRDFEGIIRENGEKAREHTKRVGELQGELEAAQKKIVEPVPFEETKVYRELSQKLAEAQQAASNLKERLQPQITDKGQELAQVDGDIDKAKNQAFLQAQAEKADARIKELQGEEKRLGVELAKCENLLAAAERFVELQAADIEGKVNEAFSLVRWQLFEKQVNGGAAPCCKATVGGVPWEAGINALNTAAQVNAGIDILNTLSVALGRSLPVWVDNAESVAYCLHPVGQCIELYVSPEDTEMRVEYEIAPEINQDDKESA